MDSECSPCEMQRLKDLHESQVFAISEDHHFIWLLPQLAFDETQQMLLVHTCTVVHMSVDLQLRIISFFSSDV